VVMLENLNDSIRECLQHAQDCERQAMEQFDPGLRENFLDTARRWAALARSYEQSLTFKPLH
jgi:hypothetical protein